MGFFKKLKNNQPTLVEKPDKPIAPVLKNENKDVAQNEHFKANTIMKEIKESDEWKRFLSFLDQQKENLHMIFVPGCEDVSPPFRTPFDDFPTYGYIMVVNIITTPVFSNRLQKSNWETMLFEVPGALKSGYEPNYFNNNNSIKTWDYVKHNIFFPKIDGMRSLEKNELVALKRCVSEQLTPIGWEFHVLEYYTTPVSVDNNGSFINGYYIRSAPPVVQGNRRPF